MMNEPRIYTLKQARALAGMSLVEAAEKIGISKNMLWLYENAYNTPSINRALDIARVYGLSIYEIEFPKELKKKEA